MKMNEVIDKAIEKSKTMEPDNSYPLMTHNIEQNGCNGLSDCRVCNN